MLMGKSTKYNVLPGRVSSYVVDAWYAKPPCYYIKPYCHVQCPYFGDCYPQEEEIDED